MYVFILARTWNLLKHPILEVKIDVLSVLSLYLDEVVVIKPHQFCACLLLVFAILCVNLIKCSTYLTTMYIREKHYHTILLTVTLIKQ